MCPPLLAALALILLLAPTASGFAPLQALPIPPIQRKYKCQVLQSTPSPQPSRAQREEGPIRVLRPVFVNDQVAFLGATMALYAFEVLTGRLHIPTVDSQAGFPKVTKAGFPKVGPPVYAFADENSLWQQLTSYQSSASEPILHLSLGPSGIQVSRSLLEQISYAGLHLTLTTPGMESQGGAITASPDVAATCGLALQQTLQCMPKSRSTNKNSPTVWVSLDVSLHTAMLQANSLPEKTPSLPHNDAYYVMLPNGDSILVDYFFTERPGGSDPLSCPSKEVLVETSPTSPSHPRSTAQSAAYTALRGNGMDPLGSAAIAASVATILGDSNFGTTGGRIPSWSDIDRAVQLGRHIRQYGTKEMPGLMRQKYVEYGYK